MFVTTDVTTKLLKRDNTYYFKFCTFKHIQYLGFSREVVKSLKKPWLCLSSKRMRFIKQLLTRWSVIGMNSVGGCHHATKKALKRDKKRRRCRQRAAIERSFETTLSFI